MNNRNVAAAGALIAACLAWAWAFGWFESDRKYSDDPVVAKLEKQRDAAVPKLETMTEAERRTQRDTFRKQMEGLSEEQRMAFFESSMPIFVPMMARQFEQRYDQFMALSSEEQQQELDKRIDEMEARGRAPNSPESGRGGRPDLDPKRADAIRKKMLDWTTPQQRAKFEHGIQLLNDRRKQRGLPPMAGSGRGFF